MTADEEAIEAGLQQLPARPPGDALTERVAVLARREMAARAAPRARGLALAAACLSLVYLTWALSFAGALYR